MDTDGSHCANKIQKNVNSQFMGPVSKMAIVDGRKIFFLKKRNFSNWMY